MVVDHWNGRGTWLVVLTFCACVGCGSNDSTTPADGNATAAAPSTDASAELHATPDETIRQFLTALKSGDQDRATSMLTVVAQQEMAKSQAIIQPPGSPTATFEVTQTEILGDQQDGAHVLSTWSDTQEDGNETTHEIVWILRHAPRGWAVAGFATRVFADQPPLVLNFEDPLDLQRKRDRVDAELTRRNEPQSVRQADLPAESQLRR
jgi:hypothetical protein